MKITYIKLENVAGLNVSTSRPVIEISFTGTNRIVMIQALNGEGKSTLLSALQPFANVTSLDERSSIPFIIAHKSGYKEIRYSDGDNHYVLKHYFKPSGDIHTVKSYFTMNDEELNQNGNVGSFNSLIEIHLGMRPDMVRLIRLGTNVNSFVSLRPAERKNYIGKLIDEIDIYLHLYRKANDALRITKTMLVTNANNLRDCHIDDPKTESKRCMQLAASVNVAQSTITELKVKLAELDRLVSKHDLIELRQQRDEAKVSLANFDKLAKEIEAADLGNVKLGELSRKLTALMDQQLEMKSSANAIRISIDSDRRRIEQLRGNVARITSNSDVTSLITAVGDLERMIEGTDSTIKSFDPGPYRSETINYMIARLTSLNQVGSMLVNFGTKPIALYMSLTESKSSIANYIKDQTERRLNHLGEADIKRLVDEVFKGESIIFPNCDEAFLECPYYRFSKVLTDLRGKAEDDLQDEDVIKYLRLVTTNVDMIMSETERLASIDVPDRFKAMLQPSIFMERLSAKLTLFSISELQDYLIMIRGFEIYRDQRINLERMRRELALHRSSGADRQLTEIADIEKDIESKLMKVAEASKDIAAHSELVADIERKVSLVTGYADAKQYQPSVRNSLTSAEKLLGPLESAADERVTLRHKLSVAEAELTDLTEQHHSAEHRLDTYHRLIADGKKLSTEYAKQVVMQEGVGTKEGIPMIYVKVYQAKIRELANSLLHSVYNGKLEILPFNISATEFEIPISINGKITSDVRYTSQSEVDLITLALSFAIKHETNMLYNIPLLDEIDGSLDEKNRMAFLRMLHAQMDILQAEQCFIISHNLANIANLPMDVIELVSGDGDAPVVRSKMQNVIFSG